MPSAALPTTDVIASCSFCGKPDAAVQTLVAGPGDVYLQRVHRAFCHTR